MISFVFKMQVLKAYHESGNARSLIAIDLDSSDNLTDEALHKFLSRYGHQLLGIALSGMPHITDQLWQSVLPVLNNAKYDLLPLNYFTFFFAIFTLSSKTVYF